MTRRDGPQRIQAALAGAADGLSVRELAGAAGLHENAVRRTLALLAAEGAVVVERRASGARGRPLQRYRLVAPADEPFKALVPLLLALLAAGDSSAEAAYAAGRAYGESSGAGSLGVRGAMVASLAASGFAPLERPSPAGGSVTLELTRCPFTDAVLHTPNGRTICHLHHGLLAGVARVNAGELDEFAINDPRVTPCRVAFHAVEPQAAA